MKEKGKTENGKKQPLEVIFYNKSAVIKFVRSEKKNPLSIETLKYLEKSFDELNSHPDIKTLIFTGSDGTFAAGADLREIINFDKLSSRKFSLFGRKLMQKIYSSTKLTIAVIDGFCMGGALDLALSCQSRIASPESYFAHPGAKLGIITGWSGTQMLPRLIGRKNALELLLTAKKINSRQALRINLIDEISANPLAKTLREFGQ